MNKPVKRSLLSAVGPGILVAATGVGAGDLATATLTGAELGTAILWAVLIGAGLKYVLNEGLTRWQLVTGTTLLEGTVAHLSSIAQWLFFGYLVIWSFLVAMALMSACGVAAHAIFPVFDDPAWGKIVFGIAQSLLAVGLVLLGGYGLFEKVMSVCIGLMFVVCTATAFVLMPDAASMIAGIFVPSIPKLGGGGLSWTIALLGGVGGTVTVLCYGYWIRESGREGLEDLRLCRIDLAVGYTMTAIFGVSMVVIGSQLGALPGSGATLIVAVAETLQSELGRFGAVAKWAFLIGAWGAVFSSLLGVWQAVPYLFVDFWRLAGRTHTPQAAEAVFATKIDVRSASYRWHLAAISTIPIFGLCFFPFSTAMKINGVVGALFIPMLAVVLLLLNGNAKLVGENRNSKLTTWLLIATLIVFLLAGGFQLSSWF